MTVRVLNIIPRKQAENAQTTQYTAINVTTILDKFTITNTSVNNVVFSVNLVAAAGAPALSNLVLNARTISPKETYSAVELVGQVLEAGGFISTLAGAAASLTISASGREIS